MLDVLGGRRDWSTRSSSTQNPRRLLRGHVKVGMVVAEQPGHHEGFPILWLAERGTLDV